MSLYLPSKLAPSTILTLPDEILVEIFTKVKTYRPKNKALHPLFASSSSDIAAVRLTCRRFAAASSHLLVHYVRLHGINIQSLEQLEAVSRHPLIRKGVRVIRLELRCYVPHLAENVGEFARWAVERVLELARRHRSCFEKEVETSTNGDFNTMERLIKKRNELTILLRKLKNIMDAWSSFSVTDQDNGPMHPFQDAVKRDWQHQASEAGSFVEILPCVRLLREAHGLYRRLYEDQEALRKDNAFVARFATAVSRMPKAKCLEVQDFQHESSMCFDCCDGNEVLQDCRDVQATDKGAGLLNIDFLLEPMSWDNIKDYQYRTPPAEFLFTLPVAIRNAGCKLDSVLVRTTTQAENYFPLLRNSMYNNFVVLGDAVDSLNLKSFAFIHGMNMKPRARETPTLEDFEAFKKYIAAMTSSDSLERFRLAVDSDWMSRSLEPENASSIGDLMISTSCRRLRDIHITGLSISLDDLSNLRHMLESRDGALDYLTLSRVELVSGCWTEALEMLREMGITDKEVLEPTGAECDNLTTSLCGGYERLFGKSSGWVNEAGQFINGHIKHNPLKQR